MQAVRRVSVIAVLVSLLAAAGAQAEVAPEVLSVAAVTTRCARGSTPLTSLSRASERRAVRCVVNEQRAAAGLRPLRAHRALMRAAQRHSRDMAANGFFAHSASDGAGLSSRVRRAGYGRTGAFTAGETLAVGSTSSSPALLVAALMSSPAHRALLLSAGFRETGIGVATGRGAGAVLLTVDLGRRG